MDTIDEFVIETVKRLRIENGYSQAAIAAKLNVSAAFIGQVEDPKHRSKYNLSHINKLAIQFKCSPKDFLPEKPFDVTSIF